MIPPSELISVFIPLQMKAVMSKLTKEEACQFVDACSGWLAKILCDTAFALWRYSYNYVRFLYNKQLFHCEYLLDMI